MKLSIDMKLSTRGQRRQKKIKKAVQLFMVLFIIVQVLMLRKTNN